MSEANVLKSDQLTYQVKEVRKPNYVFSKVLPLNTNALSISTSAQETLIEIPAITMNPAKSHLQFDIEVPATSIGRAHYMHLNTPGISQLQLYSRGGIYLCNFNSNFEIVYNMQQSFSKVSEVISNDVMQRQILNDGIILSSFSCRIPSTADLTGAGAGDITFTADTNYIEQAHVETAITTANTAPTERAIVARWDIDFSRIRGTIFALDKSVNFNETLILRIMWGPSNLFGYDAKTTASKLTDTVTGFQNAVPAATSITVSNIQLLLACDRNQEVSNMLLAKINSPSGFSFPIDYSHIYRYSQTLNTSLHNENTSTRLSSFHGRALKRILYSIYNTDGFAGAWHYERSNLSIGNSTAGFVRPTQGKKLLSYYTLLNNQRLQEYNIDCNASVDSALTNRNLSSDDFMLNRKYFKERVVQNNNQYQDKWMHVQDFTNQEDDKIDDLLAGTDLSSEIKFDFYGSCPITATEQIHTLVAVCTKLVRITSQGLTCQ